MPALSEKTAEFYAHSIEGKPVQEWHRLEEHLKQTAELAKSFADEFGCGEWANLAGLWRIVLYIKNFNRG